MHEVSVTCFRVVTNIAFASISAMLTVMSINPNEMILLVVPVAAIMVVVAVVITTPRGVFRVQRQARNKTVRIIREPVANRVNASGRVFRYEDLMRSRVEIRVFKAKSPCDVVAGFTTVVLTPWLAVSSGSYSIAQQRHSRPSGFEGVDTERAEIGKIAWNSNPGISQSSALKRR